MSTQVNNIAKGKRKALTSSYEDEKQRVYYIACQIDKNQAATATMWAFKNAWNELMTLTTTRNDIFSDIVVRKLANYLQRSSAKASKKNLIEICNEHSREYSMNKPEITVPSDVDNKIYNVIDGISKPVETQFKSTMLITSIVVCVIAIISIAFVLILSGGEKDGTTNGEFTNTSSSKNNSSSSNQNSSNSEPLKSSYCIDIDETVTYYADIDIKDYGKITVELDYEQAPITVANFVGLAQSGFYDGLTFHRIIEGFMMQGGCSNGTGTGGSGENISGEFSINGFKNNISHKRGVISMARSGLYNSASSQFFIMHEDDTRLDGQYAAFGHVTEGMDVVDAVCEAAKPTDKNGTIPKADQPIINSIKIRTEAKKDATTSESATN